MLQRMKIRLLVIIGAIAAYIPQRMPESPDALEAFMVEICRLGNWPVNDSFKNAIASQILHLGQGVTHRPKMYFVNNLRRSVANQLAFAVIQATKGTKQTAELA